LREAGFIAVLNVAVTTCPVGTLVAALAGVVEVTVGGGGGCTVVNVQV
jgi:hypothetical protein